MSGKRDSVVLEILEGRAAQYSWCSCCGSRVGSGEGLVRVNIGETTRYVLKSHLVSFAANAGPGERLDLNKKAKPAPPAQTPAAPEQRVTETEAGG